MMQRFLLFAVICGFLLSNQAYAAIVYSGSQNVTVGGGAMGASAIKIDIAGDTGSVWDDFSVSLIPVMAVPAITDLRISGSGMGTAVVGLNVSGSNLASNLTPGTLIGLGSPFVNSAILSEGQSGALIMGNFDYSGGYIGLRMMPSAGGSYYGWLHMSGMSGIGTGNMSATFDGWAYEDTGAPINAGAVPVPGALLLGSLGLGSVGWLCKRLRI